MSIEEQNINESKFQINKAHFPGGCIIVCVCNTDSVCVVCVYVYNLCVCMCASEQQIHIYYLYTHKERVRYAKKKICILSFLIWLTHLVHNYGSAKLK